MKIIYDENYELYQGSKCKCGYFYDEGDYQLDGKDDDFVKYNCDNCGASFIVYLKKED